MGGAEDSSLNSPGALRNSPGALRLAPGPASPEGSAKAQERAARRSPRETPDGGDGLSAAGQTVCRAPRETPDGGDGISAGTASGKILVLATHNAHKVGELRAILEDTGALGPLRIVAAGGLGVAPPVEDGLTFAANALVKARNAARATGLPAVADDSG
ncbi:MAG: hypothetical protein LBL01_07315, partial [Bifidobacteriaceae bacterium]|nr:hypothetical protein [Bifidobacteriaceae bacterium]